MNFCIIFDMDGTLVDSRLDLALSVNLMRRSFDLPELPIETITSFVGNGVRKLVERSITGTQIDNAEAVKRMKTFYQKHLVDKTVMYDGVAEGLATLHGTGVKLSVVTNKPVEAAVPILKKLGIIKWFDEVIGGGSGHPLKPDPEPLLYLIDKFQCRPENSWMMGDHYTDLEAGRRAGIKCCFAAYGFGDPQNETFDFRAEQFKDIISKFRK
ncbi:MAG: HAD-IA family hydrolase [Victivallaceae bacterium]